MRIAIPLLSKTYYQAHHKWLDQHWFGEIKIKPKKCLMWVQKPHVVFYFSSKSRSPQNEVIQSKAASQLAAVGMLIGPWGLGHSSTHWKGAQHPVPRQTHGNPEPIVDVGVEALHGPHRVLLQLAVQRVLLLHALDSDSRATSDTRDSKASTAHVSPASAQPGE